MTKRFSKTVLLAAVIVMLCLAGARVAKSTQDPWQTEVVDASDCWYPSLALDSSGQLHISYGAEGELKYAHFDGTTWHTAFVEEQPGATGWHSSIAVDGVDNPHISYYSPFSNTLMYAHYYSSTWHIKPVGGSYSNGGTTSLSLDAGDLPHIAYWNPTDLALMYAYDDGSSWQIDTVVNMAGTGQGVTVALVLDGADHPHLCFYDYDAGTLNYAVDNGLGWQIENVDDVFYNGQNCAIEVDSLDRPHISYRDLGLRYAHHDGISWQISTVDDDFFAGDGSSLALDSLGRPHISYTDWADTDRYDLRYAFARGGHWWIEVADVATGAERFLESSLALDQNDRPHIGYWHQASLSQLRYATRDDPAAIYQIYLPAITR